MIDKYRDKLDEKGVSPVIGVILLVAVTVALVALATVIVFDIGSEVSDTADATVDIQETSTGISVDVIRNENIDELRVVSPDGSSQTLDSDVGSSHTIEDGGGSYSIVATLGDGSEETIRTITSSADRLSGTVSYNPPAEGVLVESYDSEGNLFDSDLTNANGVYTVKEADELRVNGFTASYGDVDLNTVASNEGTSVPSILMNGDGSSSSPYEISTASDLQAMQEDLSANYIVVNDIDASGTVNWNNGQGFKSIGEFGNNFTGSLDGKKYDISGLNIKRQSEGYVGLFGAIGAGGEVKNVGVINVNMTGDNKVGSLAGRNYGTVSNSYSTGNVTGEELYVGGLVGENNGNILNSYSTGNVTGELKYVGGLVGENDKGNISNSYSTGNVTGGEFVGGLVGDNYYNGNISNSYSTGNVSGDNKVGGLVGGSYYGSVSDSYWDIESTGQSSSAGLLDSNGLTTSEMQGSSAESNMDAFDFTSTWSTVEGDYPELKWQE
jgi:flagellin-like protein